MALILPPQTNTMTADNVSGANYAPISTCREFTIQDFNATDSFTVISPNGVINTYPAGTPVTIRAVRGYRFTQAVSSGWLIKRSGVGSITFNVWEAA